MRFTLPFKRILSISAILILSSVTTTASTWMQEEHTFTPASSIASLGDSITQAANSCNPWQNCPENSWSTGTNRNVESQLQQLQKLSPEVDIKAYNNAHSGSTSFDLVEQAKLTVTQQPEYVTILSGSNDLCAPTVEQMTSTEQYEKNLKEALQLLHDGLPNTKVFVSSLPRLEQLYQSGHDNQAAQQAWEAGRICQSLLANPGSTFKADEMRRAVVYEREHEYNQVIESLCGLSQICFSDNGAVNNTFFSQEEISSIDFFHPSESGQRKLANISWAAIPKNKLEVDRGTHYNPDPEAPKITVIDPKPDISVSGKQFLLTVSVVGKNPVEKVYLDTQIGDFLLTKDGQLWTLPIDTTLVPDGTHVSFTVVAIDKKQKMGSSSNLNVTVKNNL
jgi:lysophospholipase L1-like esterase